jgi:hypothetical protein
MRASLISLPEHQTGYFANAGLQQTMALTAGIAVADRPIPSARTLNVVLKSDMVSGKGVMCFFIFV